MDNTFRYLYQSLYGHFMEFCTKGSELSKKAIQDMREKFNNLPEDDLYNLYSIIACALLIPERSHIDKNNTDENFSKFLYKTEEFRKQLHPNCPEEYEKEWWLYSILSTVYHYLYPNRQQEEQCCRALKETEEKLKNTGRSGCILTFDPTAHAIQTHTTKSEIVNHEYLSTLSGRDFRLNNRSFLVVLKGSGSSVPFFSSALRERFHDVPIKGGGMFIKWKGYGLVVDPGINFMDNMHARGLHINDINAVIVTHNHIDHNGDLSRIDDMASQLERTNIVLYVDKDTETANRGQMSMLKPENWHGLDLGLDVLLNNGEDITEDIHMDIFPTQHILKKGVKKGKEKDDYEKTTYALKMTFKDNGVARAIVGFTSDTQYLDELGDFFRECDYIVANISETNEDDYLRQVLKDTHLGYTGCAKLIEACKTSSAKGGLTGGNTIFILSEFWAGKGDVRRELVRSLREKTKYDYIYPGDVGMLFFLDQPTFLCDFCNGEEVIDHLHTIRSGPEYSILRNICEHCIL